jgi:hypothetical protein
VPRVRKKNRILPLSSESFSVDESDVSTMATAVSPVRKMKRLRPEKVEFILTHDRANMTMQNPRLEEMEKRYEKFQAWVRAAYAPRGFVELDEEYFAALAQDEAKVAKFFQENFTDSEDEE